MKHLIKIIIPIFILLTLFIYTLSIDSVPENITVFQGEGIKIPILYGMQINGKQKEKTIEVASNTENSITSEVGKTKLELKLLDTIKLKEVKYIFMCSSSRHVRNRRTRQKNLQTL